MQKIEDKDKLNVLIVGDGKNIEYISNSRFLNKLYAASKKDMQDAIDIKFNTFRELAKKCKALQIDLVIIEESKILREGITDVLRKNFINCIGANTKWAEIGFGHNCTRKIMQKYGIFVPEETKLPVNFPLMMCGDGFGKQVNSVQEVIDYREEVFNRSPELAKDMIMEKFPEGKVFTINSLFDGKNLLTFPCAGINENLASEYSKKIEKMLINEKADFIGFVNSNIILAEDKIYNIGLDFDFVKAEYNIDILYLLWLSVFQKLDEINI